MPDKPPNESTVPHEFQRYSKQIRYPGFGVEAQQKLSESCAVVVGCGALGSVSSNLLARAGVGKLILVDRDFVELSNLQRQVIYDEADLGLPKAVVAARKLSAANSQIRISHHVTDMDHRNIESLLAASQAQRTVVIDGTDNFETRFLINDACVKNLIPWVYAGCLGAEGQTMTIVPGDTACLRCLMLDGPPPPGTTATCDSGGILSTIINVVAAIQANEALKILTGQAELISRKLQVFDLWSSRNHAIDVSKLRAKVECPCCKNQNYDWLDGHSGSQSVVLCGRNAVQVSFADRQAVDLAGIAKRLAEVGVVEANDFLVRLSVDGYVLTIFPDGRAIIGGTDDLNTAKKLYAQYIGV